MFKNLGGASKKHGGIPDTPSSPQSAPLLAAAQIPGFSQSDQRFSQTSLASSYQHSTMSSPVRDSPTSSVYSPMGQSPAARYGPSAANNSPTPSATHSSSEKMPLTAPGGGTMIGGVFIDEEDLDDQLHTFSANEKADLKTPFKWNSWRGWTNGLTLLVLLAGFIVLFAGYPIINFYHDKRASEGANTAGYNLGGVNASGQIPDITNFPTLIDKDTPESAYTRTGHDGKEWKLVFSDEFEKDGRTFYPGDDPFFTAVDLHYWPTNDFEWYDPGQVTTKDGHLLITLAQQPLHDLMFRSGMVQSWNQLCFNKNAYFEVSLSLPGRPRVGGFWPGVWMMGNLGRPGYGASTDGLWPYTYSSCDTGILPNQTKPDGTPAMAATGGTDGEIISYLPGQRLSSCNCDGDHPGPKGVGRGAVEIDMIEAQTDQTRGVGMVSQSAQVAPFDYQYAWDNSSSAAKIYDKSRTQFNSYTGGQLQEAVSGLTDTCTDCDNEPDEYYYEGSGKFTTYGVEYVANLDDPTQGYIEWVAVDKPSWRMNAAAIGPNTNLDIGQRLVSEEPMALIFNLGMSNNFEVVDFAHLKFPAYMRIDYVRVYQLPNSDASVGCDPEDRPTASYIAKYPEVYNNPNLTTWEGAGYKWPTNRMNGGKC